MARNSPPSAGEEARQREGRELGPVESEARHVGGASPPSRWRRRSRPVTERRNGTQTSEHDQDEKDERHRQPVERRTRPRSHRRRPKVSTKSATSLVIAQDRSSSTLPPGVGPQEERDADIDGAGRQRRDDRLDAAVDDDAAVDEAAARAGGEADEDAERRSATGDPVRRWLARQSTSVITAPTDRSSPPVSTGRVCAMATRASANASLAFWTKTCGVKPCGMQRGRRAEHEEQRDRDEQPDLAQASPGPRRSRERDGTSAASRHGRLRGSRAASVVDVRGRWRRCCVSVIVVALELAHDAARRTSRRHGRSSRSAPHSRSSRTGCRRRHRRARAAGGRSPAWCRHRCRGSDR